MNETKSSCVDEFKRFARGLTVEQNMFYAAHITTLSNQSLLSSSTDSIL